MKALSLRLILLIMLPISLLAQKKEKIKGNKEVSSISQEIIEPFNAVEISDKLEVKVENSSRNTYVLTADENLLGEVVVEVRNGILRIYLRSKIVRRKKTEVFLKLRAVSNIVVNEDAQLKTAGRFKLDKLELIMNKGSSAVMDLEIEGKLELMLSKNAKGKFDIRADEVSIRMRDKSELKAKLMKTSVLRVLLEESAGLKLDGETNKCEFQVSGSSNLDGRKLKARDVVLESKGRADLHVRASKKVQVDASGKSKIFIYGNPAIELSDFTDRSKIIKK